MKYYILALGTMIVVCVGCVGPSWDDVGHRPKTHVAPPAALQQRPGPMVDGPGPGVMPMIAQPGMGGPGWGPQGPMMAAPPKKTQIRFLGQTGTQIGWLADGGYAENQLISPGRFDFAQGATYRLKLTNLPAGRDGLVLYPTLQVYPSHPTTDGYLAHNTVPVELTDEDLDQVEANNYVTKVIYLPDPKFQELAIAGVETLVSTRLEPGVDPVSEAARRGTIMVVLRMGNMDLETDVPVGLDGVEQVSFQTPEGVRVPPMPISGMAGHFNGVPSAMLMATGGRPGMPAMDPISGMNAPTWGMPITGTPIGLAGPPHLPYGGPAGLQSHTIRNLSRNEIPKPVDHLLIDVKHNPGYSLPRPVKHIRYTENHPVFEPGQLSRPPAEMGGGYGGGAAGGYGGGPAGEAYCPPPGAGY